MGIVYWKLGRYDWQLNMANIESNTTNRYQEYVTNWAVVGRYLRDYDRYQASISIISLTILSRKIVYEIYNLNYIS